MDTQTIIYVVAAALILRVVIKTVVKYNKERKSPVPPDNNTDE